MPCYQRDFAGPERENAKLIKNFIKKEGVEFSGIARLDPVRKHFHPSIVEIAKLMQSAISVGIRLSDMVVDDIKNEPTLIYKHHYSTVNLALNQLALKVSGEIQKKGFNAMPIPASQIVDWDVQLGHLSHRVIANQAGLGWIGRSALLVNPQAGARMRYVTILTDMPLETDQPIERDCGECYKCVEVCPAGAITKNGYDKNKCLTMLKEFAKKRGIGQLICGICVKACNGKGL